MAEVETQMTSVERISAYADIMPEAGYSTTLESYEAVASGGRRGEELLTSAKKGGQDTRRGIQAVEVVDRENGGEGGERGDEGEEKVERVTDRRHHTRLLDRTDQRHPFSVERRDAP